VSWIIASREDDIPAKTNDAVAINNGGIQTMKMAGIEKYVDGRQP
jgi:hypothetical protein